MDKMIWLRRFSRSRQFRLLNFVGQTGRVWITVLIILVVFGIIFGVVKFSTNEQKTEKTYKSIIRKHPGTNEEFRALKDLAALYIKEDNIQSAQKTTDTLTNKFSDHPKIATALLEIGDSYSGEKKEAEALRLYEYNVRTFPDKESAMWSQVGIVYSCIRKGNDIAIDAAVDKLLRVFSWNKRGLSEAILATASYCRGFGKFDKSFELHQYNVAHFPNESNTMWSQVAITVHYIWAEDRESTRNSLNTLITKSANWDILPGVCNVAACYVEVGDFYKALELYKYAADTWPQSKDIMMAKAGIIRVNIGLGNIQNAEVDVNELILRFRDNSNLAETVFNIGASYSIKADLMKIESNIESGEAFYRKATEVWERVIREFPDSEVALPQAYYFAAVSYAQDLGEYQKGIDYFQTFLDKWPDHRSAWYAQYYIGEYYEKLMNSGAIPKSVALPKIEKAYKKVIKNYSDCPIVGTAIFELGLINFEYGNFSEVTTQEGLAKGVFGFFQNFEHNTGISLPPTLLPPHWENQSQFNKTLDLIEEKWLSFPVDDYYDEVGIFLLWGNITAGRFDKVDTLFAKMNENLAGKSIDLSLNNNLVMESIDRINFCKELFSTRGDLSLLYASKMVMKMYEHQKNRDKYFQVFNLIRDNYKGTKGTEFFDALYKYREAELKYGSPKSIPVEEMEQLKENYEIIKKEMNKICGDDSK